jgi:hypothetical protein
VECEGCGARFAPGCPYLAREVHPPDPERLRVRLEIEGAVAKALRR